VFLYITVIFLWIPKYKQISLWKLVLAVSIIFGLISKRIELISIIFILLLGVVTNYLGDQKTPTIIRILSAVALFLLGGGFELHLVPGFQNLQVLDKVKISDDGIPFSLYLNFDKTIVGVFILGFLHQLITTKDAWVKMLRTTLPWALLLIIIIMILSCVMQFVRFDPKLPASLLIWSCTNLLFVCVAEEGFFRGFIQKYLCIAFQNIKHGNLLAIIIASILFGLAHFAGGYLYVMLAIIAGMGYGFIYFRTNRIEASIITHFLLNSVHFLLFTYPALASSVLP
jgi:membrane protease YdiL (CAAX protease family)